jgi:hypothetical protein
MAIGREANVNFLSPLNADIQDCTIARGFSNHERTRIDAKKWSDSRPLVFIRGSFSSLLVWGYAPPTKWSASTPKAIPGISAGRDLQRIGVTPEEAKQEARKPIWRD